MEKTSLHTQSAQKNEAPEAIHLRDFKDIQLNVVGKVANEIYKFEEKIKILLSYLANQEYGRADLEPLNDGLYSMRIDRNNRFIFRITGGNLIKDVKEVCVYSAKGHDPKNLDKTSTEPYQFD